MVSVDEKWLKIRGRWHEWFVVLDVAPAARAGRLTAVAAPLGLALERAAAALAQATPSGHHHGWVTGRRVSGAGGPACLGSR
jgi:hypothetical protein